MSRKKLFIASFAILLGSYACTYNFPDKAIVDVATVTEAIQTESDIDSRSDTIAPDGDVWFEVLKGHVPIVVTAPHATKPFRENEYRFSDGGGTAALAKSLHKMTDVTVIYTMYSSPSDPNFYDDNEFKRALDRIIQEVRPVLVLDIHGSHSYRPYDVDLGTMDGKSLLGRDNLAEDLIEILHKEGLVNVSYNYFGASKNQTITKFASGERVPAIQLEISSIWLTPSKGDLNAHRYAQLLQAMVKYIRKIEIEMPRTSLEGLH